MGYAQANKLTYTTEHRLYKGYVQNHEFLQNIHQKGSRNLKFELGASNTINQIGLELRIWKSRGSNTTIIYFNY